jgi:hypothetical protein
MARINRLLARTGRRGPHAVRHTSLAPPGDGSKREGLRALCLAGVRARLESIPLFRRVLAARSLLSCTTGGGGRQIEIMFGRLSCMSGAAGPHLPWRSHAARSAFAIWRRTGGGDRRVVKKSAAKK